MTALVVDQLERAYRGKKVLLTGHTGFKGGWLTQWLALLGADVTGYALAPDTDPALFDAARIDEVCRHVVGDIRDFEQLARTVSEARPDIIFHLAAQPLVRRSYELPLETIQTNVLGTANLLEAVRRSASKCAIVVVTSDKCYENREWLYGYRENEAMGGHDIYSMSKGAAELVASSYRRSFFDPARVGQHGVLLSSARAGNVLGGGDWSVDRLVPDCIVALANDRAIRVRNPRSVRPWQHVLEPLYGYLVLGARLLGTDGALPADFCEAWNFGPTTEATRPVKEVVEAIVGAWGSGTWAADAEVGAPHEAQTLRLSIEKAQVRLGWNPRWSFAETMSRTVEWYRAYYGGARLAELRHLTAAQITSYMAA